MHTSRFACILCLLLLTPPRPCLRHAVLSCHSNANKIHVHTLHNQDQRHSNMHTTLWCLPTCAICLKCIAVCCSVLQCVAVCVAVCCSVLQCVAVRQTSVLKEIMGARGPKVSSSIHSIPRLTFAKVVEYVAVCCSMLQFVAVCWSLLQCTAGCQMHYCVAVCCRVQDTSVLKEIMGARGPKVSSSIHSIPRLTSAKIVGSKKLPWSNFDNHWILYTVSSIVTGHSKASSFVIWHM